MDHHQVALTHAAVIEVEDVATGATCPVTSTSLANDNKTLVVEFADGLPNKACYRIDRADHVVDVAGDTDCLIRVLAGDVNGDGYVNLGDMLLAKSRIGQSVAPDNVRFDVTADASVNLGDMLAVKSQIGGTVACPWASGNHDTAAPGSGRGGDDRKAVKPTQDKRTQRPV